ncbi:MAG: filamentous hemagglutinin N-terminal domain-containing protein [Verrucomicrobiota bacterium]
MNKQTHSSYDEYTAKRFDGFFDVIKITVGWFIVMVIAFQNDGVFANPSGEQVVAGQAQVERAGSTLSVNQLTDKTIINWQDFSINHGELTKFIQPSVTSAALNRVVGGNMSAIYGTLSANGRIFLINPHGVVVGATGVINAASFTASTLDVADSEFLSGGDLNFLGNSTAGIEQKGTINALDGGVFLIAREVTNSGEINAKNVNIAAGSHVLLKQAGEAGRLFVQPDSEPGKIVNEGTINAVTAELKAVGGNVYALAINNKGIIRATGGVNENGRILLKAEGGKVSNSGALVAKNANGTGGEVQVLGEEVALESGSLIDVSGKNGGGKALIGGDKAGANPDVLNAKKTTVAAGAVILADATESGNGGIVVVWSDGDTEFHGSISAQALGANGDGGFAEISGKENLLVTGFADLRSVNGQYGELLLDPGTVIIRDGGNFNLGFNIFNDAYVAAQLGLANLTISTSNALIGPEIILILGNVNITWNAATCLKLVAGQSIDMRTGAVIENTRNGGDFTAIEFLANTSGTKIGNFAGVRIAGTLRSRSGDIILNGHGGLLGVSSYGVHVDGGLIESTGTGDYAANIEITGTGGTISLGNHGVAINHNSTIRSAQGNIALHGVGGFGGPNNYGVMIENARVLASGQGNITMDGAGGSSLLFFGNHHGIYIHGTSLVSSENGNIALVGTGGQGPAGVNHGIDIGSSTVQSTGSGHVALTGVGGNGDGNNQGILLNNNTLVSANIGGIALNGIGGTGGSGNHGVTINQSKLTSAEGSILVEGTGTASDGVTLSGGSVVESTGTGAGAATITLLGTGGSNPSGSNRGVNIEGAGTKVTSVDGNILIKGTGGNGGDNNYGIHLHGGAVVESTGTTSDAAKITFNAVGGNGVNWNQAIFVEGAGTKVTSGYGNIKFTGQGNGTGVVNYGMVIYNGAVVESTGIGDDAAKITFNGTGSATASSRGDGVHITTNARVSSVDGDITINGTGGGSGDSPGFWIWGGSQVSSTGSANIKITGVGSGSGDGIRSSNGLNTIGGALATGNITLTADTMALEGLNVQSSGNLYVQPLTPDTSIGLGDGATGTLNLTNAELASFADGFAHRYFGRANGNGAVDIHALPIVDDTTVRTPEAGGTIVVDGSAHIEWDTADFFELLAGQSILIDSGAVIRSTSWGFSGDEKAIIMKANVDGASNGHFTGITHRGTIISKTGDILMKGQGGNEDKNNYGIYISGGLVQSDGFGPNAAEIHITGTGQTEKSGSHGVYLNRGAVVTSAYGDIFVRGESTASDGIFLNGSTISSTGWWMGHGANITLIGSAGWGYDDQGVNIYDSSVTTINGDITMRGTGGTGGSDNYGVELNENARVASYGLGNISIYGTGGNDRRGYQYGIYVHNGSSIVSTFGGDIKLVGQGGEGAKGFNHGIYLENATVQSYGFGDIKLRGNGGIGGSNNNGVLIDNALVKSSGFGPFAGTITILGTGGEGEHSNHGIVVRNGAEVTSAYGDIVMSGTAGASDGILLENSTISSTGWWFGNGANITLTGIGGKGGEDQGVNLQSSTITTINGDITIRGMGGNGGFNNYGIELDDKSSIVSYGFGDIAMFGTGGNSRFGGNHHGIYIHDGSQILSNFGGDIKLVGQGGEGYFGNNNGILLENATIRSSGWGNITLHGTGGYGYAGGNRGIFLNDGSLIESNHGDITLHGQGGTSEGYGRGEPGGRNHGVELDDASVIHSEHGNIVINGTGGHSGMHNTGIYIHDDSEVYIGEEDKKDDRVTKAEKTGTVTLRGWGGSSNVYLEIDGLVIKNAIPLGGENHGVEIADNARVYSYGGDITICGTGGQGALHNVGIYVSDSKVLSFGRGEIELKGWGGYYGDSQFLEPGYYTGNNYGVEIAYGSKVKSSSGDIKIKGWGGNGGAHNTGVYVHSGSDVETFCGDITIKGWGGSGGYPVFNLFSYEGGYESDDCGDDQAGENHGVEIAYGSEVKSFSGDIKIKGFGGNGGSHNTGVYVHGGSDVETFCGDITIIGRGGYGFGGFGDRGFEISGFEGGKGSMEDWGAGRHHGVEIADGSSVSSHHGDIAIFGFGGVGGSHNNGIYIHNHSEVRGEHSSNVTLFGRGGSSNWDSFNLFGGDGFDFDFGNLWDLLIELVNTGNNNGVEISRDSSVTSEDGDISIMGFGGTWGSNNRGVYVHDDSKVKSYGRGDIRIFGVGGESGFKKPVEMIFEWIEDMIGDVDDLNLSGLVLGGLDGFGELPLYAMSGIGGFGDSFGGIYEILCTLLQLGHHSGVEIADGSSVSSVNGDINIMGKGGWNGSFNRGIYIHDGSSVKSYGRGDIRLFGVGGNSLLGLGHQGVQISDCSFVQTYRCGDISIQGKGGYNLGGWNNGVLIQNHSGVFTLGHGDICIGGKGGLGLLPNKGVALRNDAFVGSFGSGDIRLHGEGGIGLWGNDGIFLKDSSVFSFGSGDIKLYGEGGLGLWGNRGIYLKDDSKIESFGRGDIKLIGRGGDSLIGGNHGIWLDDSDVKSFGSGDIKLDGKGGDPLFDGSHGVYLTDSSRIVSHNDGNIYITGVGDHGGQGIVTEGGRNYIGGRGMTGNIYLVADTMELLDVCIQGLGNLYIKPIHNWTSIGLGDNAPGTLQLSSEELGNIHDGFNHIYFGRKHGGHTITLENDGNPLNFWDDVTFRGNTINVYDPLDAGHNTVTFLIGLRGNGTLRLFAPVTAGLSQAFGHKGDDTFIFGDGMGLNGMVDGGDGSDTLDYSRYTTNLIIDLIHGTATGTGGIANIENVICGSGDDIVYTQLFPWSQFLRGGPHPHGDTLIVDFLGETFLFPASPINFAGFGIIDYAQFEFLISANMPLDLLEKLLGTSYDEDDRFDVLRDGKSGGSETFNFLYAFNPNSPLMGPVHDSSFRVFAGDPLAYAVNLLSDYFPY